MNGRVAIVTGCEKGIGRQTALEMAKRGGRIYMTCVNFQQCEKVKEFIQRRSDNKNVFNRTLDLASFKSIHEFAENFLKEEPNLDILVNNESIGPLEKRELTVDGFEKQLSVNYLGPLLLSNLLLDTLKKSRYGRIVNVTDESYRLGARINFVDLNSETEYNPKDAYNQSKYAAFLGTRELAKRLDGTSVCVNSVYPGRVREDFSGTKWEKALIYPYHIFFKSPKFGAQSSLSAALNFDYYRTNGRHFVECTPVSEDKSEKTKYSDIGARLWADSIRFIGINATGKK